MNIILPLKKIHAAAPARQPGYLEECLRLGKVTGEGAAALIEFTPEQFADVRRRFALKAEGRSQNAEFSLQTSTFRLGDAVHRLAGPIGRALHWPCLKGDGTTDLKAGSPCDKMRKMLNAKC